MAAPKKPEGFINFLLSVVQPTKITHCAKLGLQVIEDMCNRASDVPLD